MREVLLKTRVDWDSVRNSFRNSPWCEICPSPDPGHALDIVFRNIAD